LQSLQGLHLRLRDIGQYLQKVLDNELPVNHAILGNLQDVFNLLPNLSTPKINPPANGSKPSQTGNTELARAMRIKTNDQLMSIYLSSLIRAITAFHDLIENKVQNRQQQEEKDSKRDEMKDEKNGGTNNNSKTVNGSGSGEAKEDEDSAKEKVKKKG
jgi:26S proteasome regulatory subunit N8